MFYFLRSKGDTGKLSKQKTLKNKIASLYISNDSVYQKELITLSHTWMPTI